MVARTFKTDNHKESGRHPTGIGVPTICADAVCNQLVHFLCIFFQTAWICEFRRADLEFDVLSDDETPLFEVELCLGNEDY